MTLTPASTLSVCIPVYGQSAALLEECLNSVCNAIGAQDRVLILCDGPLGFDQGRVSVNHPHQVSWIDHAPTGMVAAWNACLDNASGDLVHIMHADDRVDRQFYVSTRAVLSSNPNVGLVATAYRNSAGKQPADRPPFILSAAGTLRLLMSARKPHAGAFVLRREAVGDARFSPDFPYCADEEYFARLAARSRLAYLPAELYISRTHGGQARLATWMQPDFVDVYVDARLAAAAVLGDPKSDDARRQTALRIVSVCAVLLEMNQRQMARRHLSRLTERVPIARSLDRVRLMAALLTFPVGKKSIRVLRVARALSRP